MQATDYRQRFPNRAVFPVIHLMSYGQVVSNLEVALAAKVDGVFIIDHNASSAKTLFRILLSLRQDDWLNELWVGANFLSNSNAEALTFAYGLGLGGLWSDCAEIDDSESIQFTALKEQSRRSEELFPLFFGGVAFKYRPQHEDITAEARKAKEEQRVDVVTTSGPETGRPADLEKLMAIRQAIGDCPLATASGVTPENVTDQLRYVDAILVATGINFTNDFYSINPEKLRRLVDAVRTYQPPAV